MGYTAESEDMYYSWYGKDYRQYLLLGVVIAIIFFITAILFNSLRQPLAIVFIIPVSYIGVFLTFYWFRLNFDQGGFASFVLLCGITVNASIYILNEYNSLRRRFPRLAPLRAYVKAWNAKVVPIFLTVVSTILGFIPFMVGTDKEASGSLGSGHHWGAGDVCHRHLSLPARVCVAEKGYPGQAAQKCRSKVVFGFLVRKCPVSGEGWVKLPDVVASYPGRTSVVPWSVLVRSYRPKKTGQKCVQSTGKMRVGNGCPGVSAHRRPTSSWCGACRRKCG